MAHADPAGARAEARRILAEDRFRDADVPRPLAQPLDWIGDGLERAGEALADLLSLGGAVPGGRPVAYALAAGALLVAFAVLASRTATRRERARAGELRRAAGDAAPPGARALLRDAERAERAGELARAVRLRFRAGIARLAERGVVERRESLTHAEVARAVGSPEFDAIARDFDEIVYGGRPARAEDVATARERWARVLERAP